MFKSKFANALSTMMVGAIGFGGSAEGKLAVGYGGEAGKMDKSLARLVKKYCQDALIIARNENSKKILGDLGRRIAQWNRHRVDLRSCTARGGSQDPHGPRLGRQNADSRAVSDQSLLVAGQTARASCCDQRRNRCLQGQPLRQRLLPQNRLRRGRSTAPLLGFDRNSRRARYSRPKVSASSRSCSAANSSTAKPASRSTASWCVDLGAFAPTRPDGSKGFPIIVSDEYDMYRDGQRDASVHVHDQQPLPRVCHDHGRWCRVRRRHHGRTHSQPDEGPRDARACTRGGRSGSLRENLHDDEAT